MPDDQVPRSPAGAGRSDLEIESVSSLIERAQRGDTAAVEFLFQRCYPVIRRLAHGRLPERLRGEKDTSDVVQITFLRALQRLNEFRPQWENAWLIYMRRILLNLLRDEGRRARRLPDREFLPDDVGIAALESPDPTPLEQAALREAVSAYRDGLMQLSEPERHAVILRLEHGEAYSRIASRLGIASSDAARMVVRRAIRRLADMVEPPSEPA